MHTERKKQGFTLAEMLLTVMIIIILSGVAFIMVPRYLRSMAQLERDGIAKEIFVAAQNHLTMAESQGYLGMGTPSYGEPDSAEGENIYYFVVNGAEDFGDGKVLDLMLPFASVDETVRLGGRYIVLYQLQPALVLDVFYCSPSGTRFGHNFTLADLSELKKLRSASASDKEYRRFFGDDKAVIGWYGGEAAALLPKLTLKSPIITVTNAEKLSVTVTDTNSDKTGEGAMLKLIIEGLSSGAKKAISLSSATASAAGSRVTDLTGNKYTVVLDDITTSGFHFAELGADSGTFLPGENIAIKAVAYSTTARANICYSASNTTNSLFAGIRDADSIPDKSFETANINNIRHLENLDKTVSNLKLYNPVSSTNLEKFEIKKAVQTADMDWETFKTKTGADDTVVYYSASAGDSYSPTYSTANKNYYPVSPDYLLEYDGTSHSISNVAVNIEGNAGLFGSVTQESTISNLELIDFSITSTGANSSAGALAGTMSHSSSTVKNVLVRNTDNSAASLAKKITAATDAGGLIGKLTGGTVEYCAASVIVGNTTSKPANAGGLIGSAGSTTTITGCYSGGHTKGGLYDKWVSTSGNSYDVTGTTAGGLVGTFSGTKIENSYSTCSVSGSTIGGFAGTVSGGTISKCYAAGLVDQTGTGGAESTGSAGAFAGSFSSGTAADCSYFEIVNEKVADGAVTYLTPGNKTTNSGAIAGVSAMDADATIFSTFTTGPMTEANAYDSELIRLYQGKYNLKTVSQLIGSSIDTSYFVNTHYGDWPAPEILFENAANSTD